MNLSFVVSGRVLRYPSVGGWYYVALSEKESQRLAKIKTARKAAWGFLPVKAKIGETAWHTTLWPKSKDSLYLLVIKADVRKKEGIFEGDRVQITVSLV